MFCPSCGKEVPDKSTYCLHCGKAIPGIAQGSGSQQPVEWRYDDYVLDFMALNNRGWYRMGNFDDSAPVVRLKLWQAWQEWILADMQKELDKGWEPITEVGPAAFKLHWYRSYAKGIMDWILLPFLVLCTLGIWLLFGWSWYVEPEEFRVKMRKPKR